MPLRSMKNSPILTATKAIVLAFVTRLLRSLLTHGHAEPHRQHKMGHKGGEDDEGGRRRVDQQVRDLATRDLATSAQRGWLGL